MIAFPNAKINLGLNIIRKRNDGFHDIETVMFPIALCDVLEIMESNAGATVFNCTGLAIDSNNGITAGTKNIVIRLYELLKMDFDLPAVHIHLHKVIPIGAGLGGGSSDCTHAIMLLNNLFNLALTKDQMLQYVSQLGSDCAFFIENKPALATGRGEKLQPLTLKLGGYYLYLIKPPVHINTAQAYSWTTASGYGQPLLDTMERPVSEWKNILLNAFEKPVFERHPEAKKIKDRLYEIGALYASMSGSGSAIFGLFDHEPEIIGFPDGYFQWIGKL
ncbi:MAG: 4-(cytidine 5'-diphospho)-2-C-methyl-D-erythritol kinase [Bacteroidales bacterium]|nr:4-(cytidine 5'-diphospho)-2-C-methyl-D-erythritol kinase [Bacteroidales bacterium]